MNKDKRIKLLKNKVNRGQFYSRNKAVLSSKGEYVIIVDPDDLLLNNTLSLQTISDDNLLLQLFLFFLPFFLFLQTASNIF